MDNKHILYAYDNKMFNITVKKMQNKTSVRYHITPVRVVYIFKRKKQQHLLLVKKKPSFTAGGM